ncbi:MAG: carbohydrate ABC transporter substrate-binding protein [Rhodospirillales bacterium]|nr:carbohydrate ABC transporter substrate-binding protein [Rhodospirillales bacterium]
MSRLSRRHALAGLGAAGLGAATAAAALRPRRARAAEPVTVWWTQGFYQAENQAVIDAMAAWEKSTGTKVNLTIMNGPDLISKMIAAMQVGDVPDLVHAVTGDRFLVPRAAWDDKLVDVSDVIATQQQEFHKTALESSRFYNATLRKHSYYSVPVKCSTMMEESWRPLIEEAGFSDKDMPTTQDAYYDFFQTVQDKLRSKGRRIYGLGYSMATKEADAGTLFHAFLVAYGGTGIVLSSGKLNVDDPAVRQAAETALERLTTPYKKGYVPPGAINWGDVDNNNAFFAKQIVMTPNATISIAVAQMEKPDQYYKQVITQGIPAGNDGKPVPSLLGVSPCLIPKGAKNVDGAKALLSAFIQPATLNTYLKETRARYLPVMMSVIRNDPYWQDPADPHRPVAVEYGLIRPTIPWWMNYNPAYAAVLSEQIWSQATANITQKGMTPEQATDAAMTRIKAIFERFQIA